MLLPFTLGLLLTTAVERPKLVVLDLTAGQGIDAVAATTLTQAVAAEISRRAVFQVVTSREIEAVLSVERQKQLLGCAEDASSCVSELGGALGARFLLTGTIAQLGTAYTLTLQGVESGTAKTVGRAVRVVSSLSELDGLLPWAVAEATGLPPPPEPSRVLPFTMIGVGSAVLIGGGVLGVQTLVRESEVAGELRLADEGNASVLKPFRAYAEADSALRTMKTVSLVTMIGGAALVIAGIVLYPRSSAGVAVSTAPVEGGAIVVAGGRF